MKKAGDRITLRQLRNEGFSQCPMQLKTFSYWFTPSGMYWVKVQDGVIVKVFTE